MGWYPARARYYRAVSEDEEIEQGDILWGVPSLRATHPALADRFLPPGALPPAEELDAPRLSEVTRGIQVLADAVMVMPHTCDFYGLEKGRTHRDRLVARIQAVHGSSVEEPESLRSGSGYRHTFFLPSWASPNDGGRDLFVNFREMTSVDASYLSRRRRLTRLSRAALIALRRRLTQYFTDYAPTPQELLEAELQGGLIRGERELIPAAELRAALGEQEFARLMRLLYDPRARAEPPETGTRGTVTSGAEDPSEG